MIIRITFEDGLVMMFGNSYNKWEWQVEEYMRIRAKFSSKLIKIETSRSKWISWGGLKWCPEDDFQHQLNREGCQINDLDNPKPRLYNSMTFNLASNSIEEKVIQYYKSSQRRLKINQLNDEDYQLYKEGKLEIIL